MSPKGKGLLAFNLVVDVTLLRMEQEENAYGSSTDQSGFHRRRE
jgi:hypothetical protein